MRTVVVCDMTVVVRTVELPDRCPDCDSDLLAENALRVADFQDQTRLVTVTASGDVDWSNGTDACGTSFEVEWACAECCRPLAAGEFRQAGPDKVV